MTLPTWLEITAVALTGSGGIAGAAVLLRRLLQWLSSRLWWQGLRRTDELYEVLNTLLANTGASRAMVVASANGGGIPRPGSELTVTVMHETFAAGQRAIRRDWVHRAVDESHQMVLRRVWEHRTAKVLSEELRAGSVLRDAYDAAGVLVAHMAAVGLAFGGLGGVQPQAFLFLTLHFREKRDLTPAERDALRSAAERIRALADARPLPSGPASPLPPAQ